MTRASAKLVARALRPPPVLLLSFSELESVDKADGQRNGCG
jgi:hypothetical protein